MVPVFVAWTPFGLANVLASALLLTLGLLFLRARRSEFTVTFAAYSVMAAGQKLTGGMWLYFDTALVTPRVWQLASSMFLLASTPLLLHALAAFTWEKAFTRKPAWQKATLYAPFALAAPVPFLGEQVFRGFSLALAAVFVALLLVFLVAVARKARAARTPMARSQSRYMIAYLVTALSFSVEARVIYFLYGSMPWWELSLAYAVATGILLYGVLRAHVFDIDLKIKWTLQQSTVAAVFVAVFFVVSELAAQMLSARVGTIVGIATAGLLVFVLAPLQKAAERLVDRAVPTSADYLRFRKFEIYRSAVEHALADGSVSTEERSLLERLRMDLGIAGADAQDLEASVGERKIAAA